MRLLASSALAALLLPLLVLVTPSTVSAAPCPGLTQAAGSAAPSKSCDSVFVPLSATRLYDSRDHNQLRAHHRLDVSVAGHAGVASNAVAVAVNIHVLHPTKSTNLTVWPKGSKRPLASMLNLSKDRAGTAMTVAGIGADGKISIATAHGKTEVLVDVLGYYVRSAANGRLYHPAQAFRLFDSRTDSRGNLANGESRTLTMPTIGGVTATKMRAVMVNVTAVGAKASGHLTAFRAGDARPSVFTLNYTKSHAVSNRTVIALRSGKLKVTNLGSATNVVVDVEGWFASSNVSGGQLYSPLRPARILDTRSGQGAPQGFVQSNASINLGVAGAGRVLPAGATVAVLTLTATHASSPTGLTAWPTGAKMPAVSDVSGGPGRTTANLSAVKIGSGGDVSILNRVGSTHVLADIIGYYRPARGTAVSTTPPPGACAQKFPGDPSCSNRVFFGASVEGGDPATLEAQTGRKLSLYRSYMNASTTAAAMVSRARTDVAAGRIPLISTKVPGTWASVAAGQQDAWLLDRIRGLATVNGPVWLALHHEPAGNGPPADWVAMQQHARTLVKANSSNIALVGILNGWDFKQKNGDPAAFNMPVGTGVDIMGFDSYNGWSPTNGKAWQPAADVFAPGVTIQSWGYPTLVGEYGVRTDPANPGRAAQWLRDAYAYAYAHHFVGMSYFDSGNNSPDGTWSLDTERMLVFRANLNAVQTAWL
jgi:hypothetical protein